MIGKSNGFVEKGWVRSQKAKSKIVKYKILKYETNNCSKEYAIYSQYG